MNKKPGLLPMSSSIMTVVAIALISCACTRKASEVPRAPEPPARGATIDDWPVAGHDGAGTYHSTLADIDASNVARLGFAWDYKLGSHRGLEATPLVVDRVMYTSGNFGRVYALDAATGRERWVYDPGVDGQSGRYACCDAVNRGVALSEGRVYVASLDGYLHAIDAATGRRIWKTDAFPSRGAKSPSTLTGTPVVAGNLIVLGTGGGDFHGVRGYVEAFDAATGSLKWRFYTVPRDPALGPQDQPGLDAAAGTWDAHHRWETGGGGPVWDGISYDPQLALVYVGTGNAAPYDIHEDGRRGGDNLYTASIVALHAATGELAWFYQAVPGDMWDLDSTAKMILTDIVVDGKPRRVVMQASKNGYFYVLDRSTGEFLSAKAFAFANWTTGIDPKSGRPTLNPAIDYSKSPKLVFPWEGGAHSWQAMSLDPRTGQVFIPVMEQGDIQIETAHARAGLVEGQFTSPIVFVSDYDPKAMAALYGSLPPLESLTKGLPSAEGRGYLRAWNPQEQRLMWEVPTESYWDGGVLSTDGGLVVQGDMAGHLKVYDTARGRLLKDLDLGTTIMAAPMTYRVDGVQYIAVMAGYGGGQLGVPIAENAAAFRYGNDGRIIALKLDGSIPPLPPVVVRSALPPPPTSMGTTADIAQGEVLYNRFCARCHVMGVGILPDLRRLTPQKHVIFNEIVLNGALAPLGMGRFDDVLSPRDAAVIHGYIIDAAAKAFAAQHSAAHSTSSSAKR